MLHMYDIKQDTQKTAHTIPVQCNAAQWTWRRQAPRIGFITKQKATTMLVCQLHNSNTYSNATCQSISAHAILCFTLQDSRKMLMTQLCLLQLSSHICVTFLPQRCKCRMNQQQQTERYIIYILLAPYI